MATTMDQMRAAPPRNSDFPWDSFDPFNYLAHNYSRLRPDDEELLGLTQAWFAEHADRTRANEAKADEAAADSAGAHGIDVGCGPNLYPGLAMLPLCRSLTLVDYSHSNIEWLRSHVTNCGEIWRPFWERVSPGDRRGCFEDARGWLAERGRITHGSVYDLPPQTWDLGTMFFVAESITADYTEFDRAVRGFLRALRPGAPFAAAFMEHSQGYEIAGVRFPAVGVGETELRACLARRARELRIHRIPSGADPVRSGYSGMLLALGVTS